MFWIVPPVQVGVAAVHAPPLPVTVSPPLAPVLVSKMPLVGPLAAVPAEMLRKVRPLTPMVVLVTVRAVPVCVLIVLGSPSTVIVPPPVALKPALGGGADVEASRR